MAAESTLKARASECLTDQRFSMTARHVRKLPAEFLQATFLLLADQNLIEKPINFFGCLDDYELHR